MIGELHDTTISRLVIRAPKQVQDRVRRELQQADWPDGGSEQIIFVRTISATAASTDIGRHLLEKARRQIDHVDDGETIVRFANRLEMLAALLADLASGTAAERWYWQRWSHLFANTISKALYSVLADNLSAINALTEVLARHRQLTSVWLHLAEEEARQLIHEICWHNGYSLSETAPASSTDNVRVPMIQPTIPLELFRRWHGVPAAESKSHRFRLAVLLMAQESAPLALQQQTKAALSLLATAFTEWQNSKQASVYQGQLKRPPTSDSSSTAPPAPPEMNNLSSKESLTRKQIRDVEIQSVAPASRTAANDESRFQEKKNITAPNNLQSDSTEAHEAADGFDPRHEKTVSTSTAAPHATRHPVKQVRLDQPLQHKESGAGLLQPQFSTKQGGVLYLLNFLNRPELQVILGNHWRLLTSGWIWLYRIAELLGFDEEDPMAAFLAKQIGLDRCDELATLPSLPERDRIIVLAERWYGKNDIWQPSLLQLSARIHSNASHVDMYCDLVDVRLELRLAGLDINPGWLPWLGRVVMFHFDHHGGMRHE